MSGFKNLQGKNGQQKSINKRKIIRTEEDELVKYGVRKSKWMRLKICCCFFFIYTCGMCMLMRCNHTVKIQSRTESCNVRIFLANESLCVRAHWFYHTTKWRLLMFLSNCVSHPNHRILFVAFCAMNREKSERERESFAYPCTVRSLKTKCELHI